MNAKKKRRLAFAAALVAVGAVLAVAIVYGLGQNTMYFRSPSDVAAKHGRSRASPSAWAGWWRRAACTTAPARMCTSPSPTARAVVPVDFNGVLPALFREGQGVVATGALNASGTFVASEVLAKHDEKYMPPEVVEALKRSGRWKEGEPMIGELGQLALCFALALSLVMAGAGPVGRARRCRTRRAASPMARPWACWCSWRWPSAL